MRIRIRDGYRWLQDRLMPGARIAPTLCGDPRPSPRECSTDTLTPSAVDVQVQLLLVRCQLLSSGVHTAQQPWLWSPPTRR